MFDFVIVFEHKNRELESVVMLRDELVGRGFSVCTLQFPTETTRIKPLSRIRTRVVVVPAAFDDSTLYIMAHRCCRGFSHVVNLRWEQIFSVGVEADPSSYTIPRQSARQVTHLCWGEHTAELLSRAAVDPSSLVVVGPPQMDLLRAEFDGYYESREQLFHRFDLDPATFTVLFISSFPWAEITEEELGHLKAHIEDDHIQERRAFTSHSQTAILDWISRLIADEPALQFIYRPHPNEARSVALLDAQAREPRLRVISDYSVKQWITTCDKVYTWMSTAVAESYFAGRSCAILRPISVPDGFEVSIMEGATKISDYFSFRESLRRSDRFPIEDSVMASYYSTDENRTSTQRIADVLVGTLYDHKRSIRWTSESLRYFRGRMERERRAALYRKLFRLKTRILGRLGRETPRSSGGAEPGSVYYNEKRERDRVTAAEIESISARIRSVTHRPSP